MNTINLQKITIKDAIFGRYIRLLAESILPYQWTMLSDQDPSGAKTHCIDNFRVAAGVMEGHHQGKIFQDTDLYKWLEAVAYCISAGYREKLEPLADEVIGIISAAQQEDGYLNTYVQIENPARRWQNLHEGHELYGAGHLIEAAVAYYEATGKRTLLEVGIRFADLIDQVFGAKEGKLHGYPGHQEIEVALVKLCRVTGEKRYLDLAKYFIDERGKAPNYLMKERTKFKPFHFELFPEFHEYDDLYAQTHARPVHQREAVGHSVRALYMYSAMADLARECRDDELAAACRALYHSVTQKRMYITGGVGSSGILERFTTDYDLPNETMYCESCASVALMMFGQRMAKLTGEAHYYDTVERALMNTVLAGISVKGDRYFYVNPLEVWPDNCLPSTSMSHVKPVRQPWFATACCPPNIARTLASVGQYIYSVEEEALCINQFISSEITQAFGDAELHVDMTSSYMQDGHVRIRLALDRDVPVTVKVRIPKYLHNAVLTLNGQPCTLAEDKGYACLPLTQAGDYRLDIQGEVEARYVAAHMNVRADAGKAAVMKGPYVYCLEEADNGANLAALRMNINGLIKEASAVESLPGELPTLHAAGTRLIRSTVEEDSLYGEANFVNEDCELHFVPYFLWCNRQPGEMRVFVPAVFDQ